MRSTQTTKTHFSQQNQWEDLILNIEKRVRNFYSVPNNLDSVLDFLVDGNTIGSHFGIDYSKKRAATLLFENEKENSLEISWYIQDDLKQTLLLDNPLSEINLNNLDSFTVLTEEISHVILLIHRASINQTVSPIELELQSELDKVLLSTQLLFEQGHRNHLDVVLRSLFDSAHIFCSTEELERYRDSNKIAAQFWFRFSEKVGSLNTCLSKSPRIKMLFMKIYRAPFEEKLTLMQRFIDHPK